MVEAIDQDAVGLVGRIDGGLARARADQRERYADHNALLVGARTDVDHILGLGVVDRGLNGGITPAGAGRVDAKLGSNRREGNRGCKYGRPPGEGQKPQQNGESEHGSLLRYTSANYVI